ncbi:MAG: class II fructose-bisphosphate aldolase [bacterium]
MIFTTKELFIRAAIGNYAIGAFNVSTPEAIRGVLEAAEELNSPVIIETSEGEMGYMGSKVVADIVRGLATDLSIPVALHLDHGQSLDSVKKAIGAGYTSVHIDGSALEYDENVALTKQVMEYAHDRGVTVEGELGHIGGVSEIHTESSKIEPSTYTDPEMAKFFVEETGIDVLASSIGNVHGIYKNEPELDFDRLKKIGKIGVPLSFHGGSGISEVNIKKAISLGVTKVNVNTELRVAYTETLRRELIADTEVEIPYKYLPKTIAAVKKVVKEKIKIFGSENKA